jgi:hypothetical protein
MINYMPVTANTTLQTLVLPIVSLTNDSMQGSLMIEGNNNSAKVWFQEKADIGRVVDMTDLEDLTDDFIQSQLLR